MNRNILVPESRSTPIRFQTSLRLSPQGRGIRLIQLFDAAGEGDIGRFVFLNRYIQTMQYTGRVYLAGRFAFALHQPFITR